MRFTLSLVCVELQEKSPTDGQTSALRDEERRLCAHPFLELYRDGQIQFIVPLARQGDFYVPEVRQAERRLSEQEESHSDTDISGTPSFFMLCCTGANRCLDFLLDFFTSVEKVTWLEAFYVTEGLVL
ncbi:hypothetical protein AMECASPLE_004432 [Ameca splendens]|uniref:Uncharacterized protein n=1 Tax=Ameca splendens TaxID=208324 RepID=A0ABV0YWV7_9TELE